MGFFDKNAQVYRFANKLNAEDNMQHFKAICESCFNGGRLNHIIFFAVKVGEIDDFGWEKIQLTVLIDYNDRDLGRSYLLADGGFLDNTNVIEMTELINFAETIQGETNHFGLPKVFYCGGEVPQTENNQLESEAVRLLCESIKHAIYPRLSAKDFLKLFEKQ